VRFSFFSFLPIVAINRVFSNIAFSRSPTDNSRRWIPEYGNGASGDPTPSGQALSLGKKSLI